MNIPMSKALWLICLILTVLFLSVVASRFKNPAPKVSGLKMELPSIEERLTKPPQKNASPINLDVNARTAILVDGQSFQRLYLKNEKEKVPIASTTKIMTALVVLEDFPERQKDVVTITYDMVNIEGSDVQLRVGEKMTVENLLKGLLIVSGNDAAYSLASFLGGKDEFVQKMNQKAAVLGLKNTFYKDPAGLNDEGYSTAEDLAVLVAYALRNKNFAEIVKTSVTAITSADGRILHELKSSNRMLRSEEQYFYPNAIGVKTGFTNEAGHVLVSAAQKDGHQILSVVLNTDENTLVASAKESKKLLEWGFANWTW